MKFATFKLLSKLEKMFMNSQHNNCDVFINYWMIELNFENTVPAVIENWLFSLQNFDSSVPKFCFASQTQTLNVPPAENRKSLKTSFWSQEYWGSKTSAAMTVPGTPRVVRSRISYASSAAWLAASHTPVLTKPRNQWFLIHIVMTRIIFK